MFEHQFQFYNYRSIGTTHNIWRIINGFKLEDSLARQKLQEEVAGRATDPNPSRTDRRSARHNSLKTAMENYDQTTCKEYMFGLRDDI